MMTTIKPNIYLLRVACACLLTAVFLPSCRKDKDASSSVVTTKYAGFYLLNEGNYNSNDATIDFYNFNDSVYTKDVYGTTNPDVTLGLGDVGNDIKIYGSKMYVVVNNSNKLEIVDAHTTKHLGQLTINQPRYVAFYNGNAYVTSYDGYVAVVDTTTFALQTQITVGRQPEEMAVVGSKLYVANSGGLDAVYDRTVSVVDLTSNTESKKIDVAINLEHVKLDQYGDLYVTSRGNYNDTLANLYVIDTKADTVKKNFNLSVSNLAIYKDVAYTYSGAYVLNDLGSYVYTTTFATLNVKDESIVNSSFITDGSNILTPYGIAVDPASGDVYVGDANNYSLGILYCFSSAGVKKWTKTTGYAPGHFAFLSE